MESYPGPQKEVDLILMSQVCYFLQDSFEVQIKRALQWLRPGGQLILVHHEPAEFYKEFRRITFLPKLFDALLIL